MRFHLLLVLGVALIAGCGDDTGAGGGGSGGGTTSQTGGSTATGTTSATSSSTGVGGSGVGGAGGTGSGGGSPDGYGLIMGQCGDIDLEDVLSPDPQLVENNIDFSARPMFEVGLLSPGGQEVINDGNLGGSSIYSEAFAYEVLYRCDDAQLLKTEGEIVYAIVGKKTDLLVEIDGEKVGVSVVRAMSFPEGAPYSAGQAQTMLEGKLSDILESSVNVAPEDAWQKQILSVIAQSSEHAMAVGQAFALVDPAVVADTIVLVTVTDGTDQFIYYNQ